MSFFASIPDDAGVRHILKLNPAAGRALLELHSAVPRTDTQLTAAHKELIAAYMSGLNACQYCYGVHSETAKAFGMSETLLESLLTDLDHASVDAKLRPVLAYARLLTLTPTKVTQQHVDAIFAAGWSDRDLHDAVLTVCLFNFMNRLLEGHGVKGSPGVFAERGQALRDAGYAPLVAIPPRQNRCRLDRTKNLGAAMKDSSGSIRTSIQGQSGGQGAGARGRSSGTGCAGSWHWSGNTGALGQGCAVQARPRARLDCARAA